MRSHYADGRRVEYAVVHHLQHNGYEIMRGASSKGFGDVCAIKRGQVLIVNCKRTRMPPPAEREHLLFLADCIPGVIVPLVALKPLGSAHPSFRRLTGPGPKDWTPWTVEDTDD